MASGAGSRTTTSVRINAAAVLLCDDGAGARAVERERDGVERARWVATHSLAIVQVSACVGEGGGA